MYLIYLRKAIDRSPFNSVRKRCPRRGSLSEFLVLLLYEECDLGQGRSHDRKFWFDRVLTGKKHSKKTPKLSLKMRFGGIRWGPEGFSSGWYRYPSRSWTEFSPVDEPSIAAAQEPPKQRTPQLPEAIRIARSALCRSSHHICRQMNRWIIMCGKQRRFLDFGWIW